MKNKNDDQISNQANIINEGIYQKTFYRKVKRISMSIHRFNRYFMKYES